MAVKNLRCKECAAEYELGANFFCAECFGPLEVVYDHSDLNADEAKRRIQTGSLGIWRYSDFLPFVDQPKDPLEPGMTPLIKADRLAERLGTEAEIWVKNDAANPTHSFKDRVVAVAIAKAQKLGFETVATGQNRFRPISVTVAKSGVDVAFRRGYSGLAPRP